MAFLETSVIEVSIPLNGNKAYQLRKFKLPQREFGKTSIIKCSFQLSSNGSIAGLGHAIMTTKI